MTRPRRLLPAVLAVLAAVVLAGGALGTLAWCSTFGCTVFSEDFEPYGEKATAARAESAAAVAEVADRLGAVGSVLAAASRDGCRLGEHSWKRKDTYSHECRVDQSRIVLLATEPGEVADGLTAADQAIRDLGCRPGSWGGLDRVRDEYWSPDNPQVARAGAAGLPGATYQCGRDREIDVESIAAASSRGSSGTITAGGTSLDEMLAADWYDRRDLRAVRESGAELALVVTVSQTYYRTRF